MKKIQKLKNDINVEKNKYILYIFQQQFLIKFKFYKNLKIFKSKKLNLKI